ncbi:MAG: hypothetical protein U1F76_01340 [Candidatus Competibacteraceae bacterium]
MKIRHYLLLILTLLGIAFLQPLILLLGGVTLLGGVIAFIYADMSPESQRAWEQRIGGLFRQLHLSLSKQPQTSEATGDPRQPLDRPERQELIPHLESDTDDAGTTTVSKPTNGNSRGRRRG